MSKTFSSKSLDHLGSYTIVKSAKSFVLSSKYFAILATYSIALFNFTQDNVVAKFPYALDLMKFSDEKFDSLILVNIDNVLASSRYKKAANATASLNNRFRNVASTFKGEAAKIYSAVEKRVQSLLHPYQEHATALAQNATSTIGEYKKKGEDTVSVYLKPVNEFASSAVDKVLPKSKNITEKTKANAENELAKSIEIVSETYERSRDLISSKSSEVTNVVVSTYNKEFDSTPKKNYYVKVASASVNTGVALLKNVNSDYLQPLKETTQNYVSESIGQAEGKENNINGETQNGIENISVQLNGSSNGAVPAVEATA